MKKSRHDDAVSAALKHAIIESGIPISRIAKESGVEEMSISRFVAGTNSLRLDKAGILAAHFGLELRPKKGK